MLASRDRLGTAYIMSLYINTLLEYDAFSRRGFTLYSVLRTCHSLGIPMDEYGDEPRDLPGRAFLGSSSL